MRIEELANVSARVAATRARSRKVELLRACLELVSPSELPIAVTFLCGELTQGKIGLGAATVRRTLAVASEAPVAAGSVDSLSLTEVNAVFAQIAQAKGAGSTACRNELLRVLLTKTSERGRGFLARLILGELRHGALEGIVVESLAGATGVSVVDLRRAVMLTGDLSRVAKAANSAGVEGVRNFSLELFRPVQPMLAEPADDIASALQRLGVAALEYKLDGVRVQVHKHRDEVRVFTRHLNEVTANVPELVELVRQLQLDQAILDGEALALRPDGRPQAFQTTMRRFARTRDVDTMRSLLPLGVSFFDCLLLNGQSLIDQSTRERYSALSDSLPGKLLIPRLVTDDLTKAQGFLASARDSGHEGVMAKSLEAAYEAGGRGQNWLKVKPAHTLDLVILAAEWGSGRRRGWLSNLHLGARDPSSGEFVMIGKTFKGLTDEMLAWQTEQFLGLETSRDRFTVYVQPQLVAEIAFNEVQQSPHYDSGYALRFARVKRYRDDKLAHQSDTIDTVARLFDRHRHGS